MFGTPLPVSLESTSERPRAASELGATSRLLPCAQDHHVDSSRAVVQPGSGGSLLSGLPLLFELFQSVGRCGLEARYEQATSFVLLLLLQELAQRREK
jgi:hypothetical protein